MTAIYVAYFVMRVLEESSNVTNRYAKIGRNEFKPIKGHRLDRLRRVTADAENASPDAFP